MKNKIRHYILKNKNTLSHILGYSVILLYTISILIMDYNPEFMIFAALFAGFAIWLTGIAMDLHDLPNDMHHHYQLHFSEQDNEYNDL